MAQWLTLKRPIYGPSFDGFLSLQHKCITHGSDLSVSHFFLNIHCHTDINCFARVCAGLQSGHCFMHKLQAIQLEPSSTVPQGMHPLYLNPAPEQGRYAEASTGRRSLCAKKSSNELSLTFAPVDSLVQGVMVSLVSTCVGFLSVSYDLSHEDCGNFIWGSVGALGYEGTRFFLAEMFVQPLWGMGVHAFGSCCLHPNTCFSWASAWPSFWNRMLSEMTPGCPQGRPA